MCLEKCLVEYYLLTSSVEKSRSLSDQCQHSGSKIKFVSKDILLFQVLKPTFLLFLVNFMVILLSIPLEIAQVNNGGLDYERKPNSMRQNSEFFLFVEMK